MYKWIVKESEIQGDSPANYTGTVKQQAFADFVKQQYVLWGDLIKAAGIEQK